MRIGAVLTDIEGTTSSIHFVHQVLFPHARAALPGFLREHAGDPATRPWLEQVAAETGVAADDLEALTGTLLQWIDADRKHTALKALQGQVWRRGYGAGEYRAHLYPEVADRLRAWQAAGLRLFVYSSGSVEAQQLFFGHSEAGDLRPLFEGWFDTTSGPKREAGSYARIAAAIGLPPARVLFLSDIEAELDAAAAAGMATTLLVRDPQVELPMAGRHRAVRDFDAIDPEAA